LSQSEKPRTTHGSNLASGKPGLMHSPHPRPDIFRVACPTEDTLYAADELNFRVRKLEIQAPR
jgi:hypothetical protein